MPKFLDKIRQKVTEETVQENLPTIIDLAIAGFGALIFFTGGGKGHHKQESPTATTYITNNYYGHKEDI
jgi:hypothetical protein